jgi:hypothetical protein
MTLAQTAEKPITVAIDEAINSFADKRQGRPDKSRRLSRTEPLATSLGCARNIAAGLSDGNASLIS